MRLYDVPHLYAELCAPEQELITEVRGWVARHLAGPCRRVLEPACGTGTWLAALDDGAMDLVGFDIDPAMVAEARRRARGRVTVVPGDMTAFSLPGPPFDLAINLSGSVGHLATDAELASHLAAVSAHLRPGGIYLLGLAILDGKGCDSREIPLFSGDPTPVPGGGVAALRVDSLERDFRTRTELIRNLVLVHEVPGVPAPFTDTYRLRFHPLPDLLAVLGQVADLEPLAAYDMRHVPREDVGLVPDAGDVTLVLRRR